MPSTNENRKITIKGECHQEYNYKKVVEFTSLGINPNCEKSYRRFGRKHTTKFLHQQ